MALEVFCLLVLDEDLLIVKVSITIPGMSELRIELVDNNRLHNITHTGV